VSKAPPIEDMDPDVEPRLGWYLPLELGLCEDSYRGKAYSLLGDAVDGESSGDGKVSVFLRGWGEDMMILSRPQRPLEGSSTVSITFTGSHRGIIACEELC
jgi:hypothetical protein